MMHCDDTVGPHWLGAPRPLRASRQDQGRAMTAHMHGTLQPARQRWRRGCDGCGARTGQMRSLGAPSRRDMRSSMSASALAGNSGSLRSSSPKMQPAAHMSTASVYVSWPSRSSGALRSVVTLTRYCCVPEIQPGMSRAAGPRRQALHTCFAEHVTVHMISGMHSTVSG